MIAGAFTIEYPVEFLVAGDLLALGIDDVEGSCARAATVLITKTNKYTAKSSAKKPSALSDFALNKSSSFSLYRCLIY